jgi:predicted dehydrogenase
MNNGVIGQLFSNFKGNWLENSLRIVGTKGELFTNNFVAPHMFHYLSVSSGDGTKRTEKLFQSGWSSYRHQLEAFVGAVKNGTPIVTDAADAVKNLKAIEMIFDAAGLPRRGKQSP